MTHQRTIRFDTPACPDGGGEDEECQSVMKLASFFSGIGGFDLAFDLAERDFEECLSLCKWKSSPSASESSPDSGPTSCDSMTSARSTDTTAAGQAFTAADSHAKMCPWPENVRASLVKAAACSLTWCAWWMKEDLPTLFGRMFPDCSPPTEAGTSALSSTVWPTSGITEPSGCWTASTLEWASGGGDSLVCSLKEMLDGDVPQRFYLSPRAAAGILRRAAKRGRQLPAHLLEALTTFAGHSATPEAECALTPTEKPTSPPACAETPTMTVTPSMGAENLSPRLSLPVPDTTATATHEETERTTSLQVPSEWQGIPEGGYPTPREQPEGTLPAPTPPTASTAGAAASAEKSSSEPSPQPPMIVRRLCPTETERLQGFPVGWTIPKEL